MLNSGCGKTTTCAQFANHYQKKGLKTGLVCTYTLRNGAFDQFKQIYAETNIPCYGRYIHVCISCDIVCRQEPNMMKIGDYLSSFKEMLI